MAQMAALLHDRMTESVLASRAQAEQLFTPWKSPPMEHVDVLAAARSAGTPTNRAWAGRRRD